MVRPVLAFSLIFFLITALARDPEPPPEVSLSVYPEDGDCIPGRSTLPLTLSIVLLNVVTEVWIEAHSTAEVCIERRDSPVDSNGEASLVYSNCFPDIFTSLPHPILLPPSKNGAKTTTVNASLIHSGLTLATVTNTYHLTNTFSHCETSPPTIPSPSTFPPNHESLPSLSIRSPRNGDIVNDNDTAIISLSYTELDSSSTSLDGRVICVGYTASAAPPNPPDLVSTVHGCLESTGPFTELKILESSSRRLLVTLEVELKPVDGGEGGGFAVAQFGMGPSEECDSPPPVNSKSILSASDISSSPSAFSSIPLLLVMAHWKEDLSWFASSKYPAVIYHKHPDDSGEAPHFVPHNVAGEAR
jgi:hypothetical protein